jgi:hypothetical protein
VESCSSYRGRLVAPLAGDPSKATDGHPLIAALHAAFMSHRPVCLSPDVFWLTLTQGLAHHINAHAESLRPQLVRHEGKLTIQVRRDDFVKGSPENPWPEVFAAFSEAIRHHIGDTHDLIVADFSTTGAVECAASEVVLLDAMQPYFCFELHTCCGIPSLTLEGTTEDWRSLARRVRLWKPLGLEWWIRPLLPILEQFAAAAAGRIDRAFWDSIYKWRGSKGSGSACTTGWILTLFPYLHQAGGPTGQPHGVLSLRRNPWLGAAPSRQGPGRDQFPGAPAKAPFRWVYFDQLFDMEFVGGLVGVCQDPDSLCLRPEIGWAVREAPATREASARLTGEAVARIVPGMPLAEVAALLGDGTVLRQWGTARSVGGGCATTTTAVRAWREGERLVLVTFENDRVVQMQHSGLG